MEVTAATTAPAQALVVTLSAINYVNGTDTSTLLDIGTGAGGSEVVVVPNLGVGAQYGGSVGPSFQWVCPVSIPKGTRLAVRAQSTRTSQNIGVWITPLTTSVTRLPSPTALVDVCANTATSYGVALTAPGATNTKSAWTELTASCPQALQAILLCPQVAADLATPGGQSLVDIAVGAAGAEVTVVANWPLVVSSSELLFTNAPTLWPVNIPKGARIAARYQTTNTGNGMDMQLIGVPA